MKVQWAIEGTASISLTRSLRFLSPHEQLGASALRMVAGSTVPFWLD